MRKHAALQAVIGVMAVLAVACSDGTSGASSEATGAPTAEPVSSAAAPSEGSAVEPSVASSTEPSVEPSNTAAFEDIKLAGKGKKIAKFTIPEETPAIATITHKGKENFIVHTIDASGELIDGLVNEIGNYAGTVLFGADAGEVPAAFEIDADGAWVITVKPITASRPWDPSTKLTGKGDDVVLVSPPSNGLVTLDLTYKGDSNFIVHAYSADGIDSLANEIGDFTGEVLLPDGTQLIEVVGAGGVWSATPG